MAGQVVTITSGKGGVGKTTTTGNLAVALAQLRNRVVCIDLDIGLRSLDLTLGLENRIVYDIVDVIEGRVRLHQALVRDKRLEQLYLLPAAHWREKTAITEKQVEKLCQHLREEFDFVLIDSPAGIEAGFRNAIAPADQVLIVCTPEVSAVRDAGQVIEILKEANMPKRQLILNRVRQSMIKRGDMLALADILELLGIGLIGIVPEDENVIANANKGTPVIYSKHSQAGPAFAQISRRLMGEQAPFASLDSRNWLRRLTDTFGI